MSSSTTSDIMNNTTPSSKPKKNKRKKIAKAKSNGEPARPNGFKVDAAQENDEEGDDADSRMPTEPPTPTISQSASNPGQEVFTNEIAQPMNGTKVAPEAEPGEEPGVASRRIFEARPPALSPLTGEQQRQEASFDDSKERFDALAHERDALREEVAQVRKALGKLQERHEAEVQTIQKQLLNAVEDKKRSEADYSTLVGKVNTIKSQLGSRLKADAEDLSQARSRIKELEEQNSNLLEQNDSREAELASLADRGEQQSKELSGLRNRTTLSQQNFAKEREDLLQREAFAKEEFENAKQAMQEWEILATEERSIRESIANQVSDLEDQVATNREAHERAASELNAQSATVDGLQRALQELQDARRRELREMVENSQSQIESLQNQLRESEARAAEASSRLVETQQELDRALPFEKEVKEKNLLIGKLRHEAVILNDHLTKALRYLKKKGKEEETIDKRLVTNHFMHFLALERADPKKFQVLQIIANLLDWSDEQRETAGLARPGASNPNLRIPVSPWHRTPSTPALSNADFSFDNSSRKESLAELWSSFLEQEAHDGVKSPKSPSATSVAISSSVKSDSRLP